MDLGKGSFDFYLWHSFRTTAEDTEQSGQNVNSVRETAVLLNKVNWNLTIFLLHPSVSTWKSNLHTNIFTSSKKRATNSIWQILATDTFKATLHWAKSLRKDTHLPLLLCRMSHAEPKARGKREGQEEGRAESTGLRGKKEKTRKARENENDILLWSWPGLF